MRLGTPKTPAPGGGLEPAWRADFLSADECAGMGIGLLPAATPPSVDQGLVLNGTTQYARVLLAQYTQAFQGGTPGAVSIYCEFFPDFNYDVASNHVLWDGVAPNRYICYKDAGGPNYNLTFYAGATVLIGAIPAATYGPLWRVGQKNRVMVTAVTGDNSFYLNGSLILSGNIPWTRVLPAMFDLGASGGLGTNFFDGTITDFQIYNRKLTSAEALQLTTVT